MAAQEGEPAVAEDVEVPPSVPAGKHVLVVEDERDVATFLRRTLSQDGHQVVIASNGQEAIERILTDSDDLQEEPAFDLIISDIKMPGLGGPDLYRRLQEQRPGLARRVIFVTGDTMNATTQGFLASTGLPYLTKPFTVQEFRRAISQILT
jgi:two-component system NtrC family sensor kinase